MTARVDAAAGVVVDDDDTWPLRLDCRTGGAVLGLPGRDVVVTPLRWRHKQRLARWAHLGPQLVADQRVALAVEPGTPLGAAERALVEAVVAFLDGDDALPCEPGLLASVAVEACRVTGLAPAAFDDRDAAEVELIWRTTATAPVHPPAASGREASSRPAPDAWADATSIVFGPAPDPERALEASEASEPTASVGAAPAPAPASAPLAGSAEARDRAVRRREAPRYRIAPAVAPRPIVEPTAAPAPAPTTAVETSRPDAAVWPAESTAARPVALDHPGSASRVVSSASGPGASAGPAGRPPVAWSPAAPAVVETAAVTAPSAPTGDLTHGPVPVASVRAQRPLAATAAATIDDPDSLDRLVAAVAERIADQVAAATEELGIEV